MTMRTGIKLGKCYQVESNLGEGSFGFVCKCRNTETGEMVAIKVNKNNSDVIRQTKDEITILKKLQCFDPDACSIIQWNGFFFDKDRICLNFELLDLSLLDYMECTDDDGLPMTELKPIIYQLATALSHLRSIEIVHSDLKPDNVMVVDRTQQPLRVKLIDFGLARPVSAFEPGDIVQHLWYRAPEVIIGLLSNEAIDMWSLGLLAAELATGDRLYPGQDDYDVLNIIIQTQGLPADDMLDCGEYTELYFNKESNSQERWGFKTPEEYKNQTGYHSSDTRYNRLRCLDDLQKVMVVTGEINGDQCLLVDLIKRMLEVDPDKRIKPLEVLQHPFFETTEVIQQSSWNQTTGPENIDCTDDVSYYKTKKKRRENVVPEVIQQSSCNQTTGLENIQCGVESSLADTSDTVESEEATSELDKSKHSKTSFEMATDHTSLNMPTGIKLGKCHQVESNLGEGSFGFVCKCRNTETGEMVAIKVNKNNSDVIRQTKDEITILKKLQCFDPDACSIIQWNGFFFDKDRICLNFELLDLSLLDYMECTDDDGLPMTELKPIIYQLATALSHLRSIEIVHSDLKPDNVMVVDRTQQPLRVKLIDFGLARPVSAFEPGDIVQNLWYRAPEVIIGLLSNEAIDMWSLGLLAAELATGARLYPGQDDYDVLNFIIQTQGLPADDMLDRGEYTELYFNKERNSQERWGFKTPEEYKNQTGYHSSDTRYNRLRCLDDLQKVMMMTGEINGDQCLLVDLIKRMLEVDPDKRIKPLEVLQHPFFQTTEVIQQSSWNQTAGPENIDCTDDVSYYKTKKKRRENVVPEVIQQSSCNQTTGPENIQCRVESPLADTSDTVESEEATSELDKSKHSKTSFEMAMDHKSLNMPTGIKLGKCYQVESNLGEGGFGFVCKCRNTETGEMVAIKVNKNNSDVIRQTKDEITILKKLQCFDPDACRIIQWNGFFFDKDRICLNFELLDLSLLDYMECTDDDGLPMTELKPIIYQLATALSHLRSIGIVHSDLKPDNVMVVDRTQQPLRVKLIDFGLARPVSAFEPGDIVQNLWYRAPEVIIGLLSNEAIDMWSLGLLAAELATGARLYPGQDDYDVLNFIIQTQGLPADDMLDRGEYTELYFNKERNSQERWGFKTPEEYKNQTGYHSSDTRYNRLRCLDDLQKVMMMTGEINGDQCLLVDLIKRMLEVDPDKRIKPLEVLQHPFFQTTEVIQQSSWNQTAGPENIDCTDDVSYYKTKKKRRENVVPEVIQQSSCNQTTGPENIQCRVESPLADTSDTVESEEATSELDKSKHSKTSFEMAMDHKSLNMPTGIKLGKCYQVESNLGEGGFGFVCKCRNTETGEMVAIKVNKNNSDVIRQTKDEITILKKLQCFDPDACRIIQWNGFFFDKDRICLNFELLDLSLLDYMECTDDDGLPMTELKPIIYQLATALSHLRSIGIVHSDLKPDNVMVVDRTQQPLRVKLIDFGLACPVSDFEPGDIVQHLWYRAPEVIIGLLSNEAIDMWSLGLLAAELATGAPLYPGQDDYDVLNIIIQTQGLPADDMLDRGEYTELYFNKESNSQERWGFKTPEEYKNQTGYHSGDKRYNRLRCLDDLQKVMVMTGEINGDQCLLVDLIKRMLEVDPDKRIKPLEVLQHPFFQTTEVIQQCSWTAGPENIDCNDDVSYYKKKKKRRENIFPETLI